METEEILELLENRFERGHKYSKLELEMIDRIIEEAGGTCYCPICMEINWAVHLVDSERGCAHCHAVFESYEELEPYYNR